jgi:hypothetical protein
MAYLFFVAFMVAVVYVWPVEFRSPTRYGILVPSLMLFFDAILLTGLPMFHTDRKFRLVTAATRFSCWGRCVLRYARV